MVVRDAVRRRYLLFFGLALIFLMSAMVVVVTMSDTFSRPNNESSMPESATVPPSATSAFSEDEAQQLEDALVSGDQARVAEVIVLPHAAEVDASFVHAMAEMGVNIDAASFLSQEAETGTVLAEVGGRTWTLVLTRRSSSHWLLLSTVEQS